MALQPQQDYQVRFNFTADGEGEISVHEGQIVRLLQDADPNTMGWVSVALPNGSTGYMPKAFLGDPVGHPSSSASSQTPPPPNIQQDSQQGQSQRVSIAMPPETASPFGMANGFQSQQAPSQGNQQPFYPFSDVPQSNSQSSLFSLPQQQYQQQQPQQYGQYPTQNQAQSVPPPQQQPQQQQQQPQQQPQQQQQQISTAWKNRDMQFPPFEGNDPLTPNRQWFYRDMFNDVQGPFDAAEMRERVDNKSIDTKTSIGLETGSPTASSFEERPLMQMFPNIDLAFLQAPVLDMRQSQNDKYAYFFIDSRNTERGPFAGKQMKYWLDRGYFYSGTKIRSSAGTTKYEPLGLVFPDPQMCFASDPAFRSGSPHPSGNVNPTDMSQSSNPYGGGTNSSGQASTSGNFERYGSVGVLEPKPAASGRNLLKHALHSSPSESGSEPPPAVPSDSQPADGQSHGRPSRADSEAEDSKLADAVHLGDADDEQGKNKKDKKDKKEVKRHVYGDATWKPFKGIPKIKNDPSNYATSLYTFMTRPLHPDAGTVKCTIRRDIDGSHMNFNIYQLFIEDGNIPVLAGYRHHHTIRGYYDLKMNTTADPHAFHRGLTIAQLEVNFLGTQFLLHNNVPGHQGKPRDMACVLYDSNKVGSSKGPRRMRTAIPKITGEKNEFHNWEHQGNKGAPLVSALKSLNIENIIALLNKPPKWNARRGAYMLDFHGRVTRASVKNFQLVDALRDPNHESVLLQHGRTGQNSFTMDVCHPLSITQAFAICLSSLHAKRTVD